QVCGECERAAGDEAEAARWFTRSIQHSPRRVEGYAALARSLRRLDRRDEAEAALHQLVETCGESPRAWLGRRLYWLDAGDAARAAADFARALALAPDDVEILLAAADAAQKGKDVASARRHLGRAVDVAPRDARPFLLLARLEFEGGRGDAARDLLRRS